MKTKRILAAVILALIAVSAHSHAAIAYLGGTYSDNLDGMGNSSSWINDSTLPGWYAYKGTSNDVNSPGEPQEQWGLIGSSFAPGNGGAQTPLINFGNSGTSANRSLGTYTAIYSKDVAFALVLRNDTATVFSNFTLSYFGEQWAVNAQRGDASMKLDFSYGVFSSFNGAAPNPNTVIPHSGNTPDPLRFYEGYTRPANGALNFAAFQFSFENQSIDGNAPENRRLISSTQPADWAPGQFLVLRRFNDYGFGSGQIPAKLAVNDVQVTAGGAVPEPGSAVLLALGAAMLGARRKRANVHRDSTQD